MSTNWSDLWVDKNYVYRLILKNGWGTNLGHKADTLMRNYPCKITWTGLPSTLINPGCDVYTGGSTVLEKLGRPYIEIYGIKSGNVRAGDILQVIIPKILLANSSSVKVDFILQEVTDDSRYPFVEIYKGNK